MMVVMGIIEDFVSRYRKEYDFYNQAARLVAQTVEGNLQAAGIQFTAGDVIAA